MFKLFVDTKGIFNLINLSNKFAYAKEIESAKGKPKNSKLRFVFVNNIPNNEIFLSKLLGEFESTESAYEFLENTFKSFEESVLYYFIFEKNINIKLSDFKNSKFYFDILTTIGKNSTFHCYDKFEINQSELELMFKIREKLHKEHDILNEYTCDNFKDKFFNRVVVYYNKLKANIKDFTGDNLLPDF